MDGNDAARRIAIIDLGSNSARAIILRCVPGYSYHLEDEVREIVRLREGMTDAIGLSDAAMMRGLLTLRLFKRFCDSVGADEIIATATSAVREAANGEAFLRRVADDTGLNLRILSGEEEAYYGVLGALNAVLLERGIVIDIGGGSAQVSQIRDRRFAQGQALTLGALALTERFVRGDPIQKTELQAVRDEIARQLDTVPWLADERGSVVVGLGGTIRNLAKIEATRLASPLNAINGFELTRSALDATIGQLIDLPLAQRRRIPGLKEDRADIILPGALVLRAVLERVGADRLTISGQGLREGLFCEQFWSRLAYPVAPNLRAFSIRNLARFYQYNERHADTVQFLAGRLFDQLVPLHGFGAWERELLTSAAILHDIGTTISYNDHHKYSQILIAGNVLPGFSPREIALIGLLTRFHRKGTPQPGEYAPLLEPSDDRRLRQLAALLRLCEYLERGRTGIVRDVHIRSTDTEIHVELDTNELALVEIWDAKRNAVPLMETAFGRTVTLENRSSFDTIPEVCAKIEELWNEHRAAPFPRECLKREQINGQSLVLLDSGAEGCISTFIQNDYNLDLWRTASLGNIYHSLALVLPEIPVEGRAYYTRLETLAGLVLQAVGRTAMEAQRE